MSERHDIWQLLDGLQMDLRAAQGKLTSVRSLVAGMNLAPAAKTLCPTCGLEVKGPRTLAEHVHVSHDGPLPDHWADPDAAEANVGRFTGAKRAYLAALESKTEVTE